MLRSNPAVRYIIAIGKVLDSVGCDLTDSMSLSAPRPLQADFEKLTHIESPPCEPNWVRKSVNREKIGYGSTGTFLHKLVDSSANPAHPC